MVIEPNEISLKKIILLINEDKVNKALIEINKLIKKFPNSVLSLNILGVLNLKLGNFDQAIKVFQKTIDLKSDFENGLNNLGLAYYKNNNFNDAIFYFQEAIKCNAKYIDPHLNLSSLYKDIKNFTKSIQHCQEIIKINKNFDDAYFNMGHTYKEFNKIELAIKNFKKAISINRNKKNYLKAIGVLFLNKGEITRGVKYLEEYLQIYPNSTEVFYLISLVKKFKAQDSILNSIFSVNEKTLSNKKKMYFFFTLGKVYFDLSDFKKSFIFYEKANLIKRSLFKFNIKNEENLLTILKNKFSSRNVSYFPKLTSNDKQPNPIFIVGMPRSGTTLIEQVLSKHSKVEALGELEFLGDEINNLNLINSTLTKEKIINLKNKYYMNLNQYKIRTKYFTDKTPINFRWIGFIILTFPKAKIIHIKRETKAVCWSNFKSNFNGEANGFSNSLPDLVKYYNTYNKIINFYKSNFKGRFYNLCYENYVNNFQSETKKLFSYLQLDWERNCLNFYESNRFVNTASFAQVKKKIYINKFPEWENYKPYLKNYFKSLNCFKD